MITRKEMLNGEASHDDYYLSIAKTCGLNYNKAEPEFLERVKKALNEGDEHLNSIPLKEWDQRGMAIRGARRAFEKHGDYPTLAGLVCLVKSAARAAVQK